MNAALLRAFFHRAREWARANRGRELFHMAAQALAEFAEVDSGFFVYQKQIFVNGLEPQKPMIFEPWGVFAGGEEELQILLDKTLADPDLDKFVLEKWILSEDLPVPSLRRYWENYPLLEIGCWPLITREITIGYIFGARTRAVSNRLTPEMSTAIMDSCAAHVSVALDFMLARRIAEEASERDLLTGSLNRRGLESHLADLVGRVRDEGKFLVFAIIDMDNLKVINDSQGHPMGDQALKGIASVLTHHLRSRDLVCRYGGDEFVIAFASETPDYDLTLMRLQQAVLEQTGYSISTGAAVWGLDGSTAEACYRVADGRLYECKRRNKSGMLRA